MRNQSRSPARPRDRSRGSRRPRSPCGTGAQQPFHGLLHAIVGRDAVDDEERVSFVVASDELAGVGAAEHVEFVLLQGEMRRQLAVQSVPTGRTTESGRAVAGMRPWPGVPAMQWGGNCGSSGSPG